ncbi:unnamed protein product [Effrenium voratum]|nr:unnamed protein product [Effrenium voratum]
MVSISRKRQANQPTGPAASEGALHDVKILRDLDERFDTLEANVAMIPELEDRIAALELMMKAGGAMSPMKAAAKEFEAPKGPRWSAEESPGKRAPPEDDGDDGNDGNQKIVMIQGDEPKTRRVSQSGGRTRKSIAEPRLAHVDESILDSETKEYYSFGESTWDLVLFIGTGALGPMGSLQTFILAIVNVLMQGIFVGIAWFNFLAPDINESTVQDAFRWRRSSGHSLSYYDEVSMESLAKRVCDEDKSLHISGIQVQLIEDIRKYLKPDAEGMGVFFTGQVLCMVALICWYLMVAKEVSHALALHRGVHALPNGKTTITTRENPFTQVTYYKLGSVTRRRKTASALLLVYRLVAAVLLIYVGTFFLVYTVSVTELILNAVALGIILDIDDLLFDALATTPGRHLVNQLDPLPMPAFPRFRGADAKSTSMSLLIPGGIALVYFMMLAPFVSVLNDVSTKMCGGNQQFVWSTDKRRRVVNLSPTSGGGWDNMTQTIQMTLAIDEAQTIPDVANPRNAMYGVWVREVTLLQDMESLTLEELIQKGNPQCGDMANEEPMLNYLREGLGNWSVDSCADAEMYCNSLTEEPWSLDAGRGYTTRMFCPGTCGCNVPGGNYVLTQGCAYASGDPCLLSNTYQEQRTSATCVEPDAAELRSTTSWASWVQTIQAYGNSAGNFHGKAEALKLAEAMWDHGCGFGQNLTDENVTWGDCYSWSAALSWPFKTLEFFCPVTCDCRSQYSKNCNELQSCLFHNEAREPSTDPRKFCR